MQLRALELSDLNLLFALENDAQLWPISSTRAPLSRAALKQYVLRACQHDIYALRQLRLVATVGEECRAVALVDLVDFSPEHHRAEVGIVVLPEERKQGQGREALRCLADYCRTRLSLHQLYAYVPAGNAASQGLFASAGYELVGRLPDWLFYDGQYEEVLLYVLRLR